MAATCIGVFLLAILLEFVRRVGKEYDLLILRQFQQHVDERAAMAKLEDSCCSGEARPATQTVLFRATAFQQAIRSLIRKSPFQLEYCYFRSYEPRRHCPPSHPSRTRWSDSHWN